MLHLQVYCSELPAWMFALLYIINYQFPTLTLFFQYCYCISDIRTTLLQYIFCTNNGYISCKSEFDWKACSGFLYWNTNWVQTRLLFYLWFLSSYRIDWRLAAILEARFSSLHWPYWPTITWPWLTSSGMDPQLKVTPAGLEGEILGQTL